VGIEFLDAVHLTTCVAVEVSVHAPPWYRGGDAPTRASSPRGRAPGDRPDFQDLDAVDPVVAEVEPVEESRALAEEHVAQSPGPGVSSVERETVPFVRRAHETPSELELVEVLIPAVEGREDRLVKVVQGMAASELHARPVAVRGERRISHDRLGCGVRHACRRPRPPRYP
jgi:hypothetical protein